MAEEQKKIEQKAAEPAAKPAEAKTVSDIFQTAQIALDSYDDIFSDFDPSPYERRILSDDFLSELRRRHAEKRKGEFVVNFTLPASLRSEKTEALVRKRIKDYFRGRLKETSKERRDKFRQGLVRVLIGVVISFSLILFPQLDALPLLTLVSVLIWYALWSGFDELFEVSSRLKRKQSFYEKFLAAAYNFMDQEELVRSMVPG
jgi:hypothetical protein